MRGAVATLILLLLAGPAVAHVGEKALVLLLPTEIYIPAGVLAVAASMVLIAFIPAGWLPERSPPPPERELAAPGPLSLLPVVCILALIATGRFGPRDPLTNLLPVAIWTGLYIAMPVVQLALGDVWRALNPWRGLEVVFRRRRAPRAVPEWLGYWPAVASWCAIIGFALADPAPADPTRLSWVVLGYWGIHAMMVEIFGLRWLERGEGFTAWFGLFARLSPLSRRAAAGDPPLSLAIFIIAVLAAGSFDGLNETFLWLDAIGINPLEFPGRSAVIVENLAGLAGAMVVLTLCFGAAIVTGLALIRETPRAGVGFRAFALSLVPIAVAYHLAHYLPVALVSGQYAIAAIVEPLHLGHIHVTTSFFNTPASVRLIWLTQAGLIVAGHILGVIAAHRIALRLFDTPRHATRAQLPLAALMIGYTLFGLWLLASASA